MLSTDALEDFKAVFREEFGVEPDDEQATEQALALLSLFNVIYKPIKKKWVDEYENGNLGRN